MKQWITLAMMLGNWNNSIWMPVKLNHDVKLHCDDPAGIIIISMLGTWQRIKFNSQYLLNSLTADVLIP